LNPSSKDEAIRRLSEEVEACRRCGLCEGRKRAVIGEGDLDSPVVLVGEAPGRKEDEQGRPFVGSAGRLLDVLLAEAGFERRGVYITNVVKCRPPGNRRPKAEELRECTAHLERQLEIIAPRVLVPMGNSASGYVMRRYGLGGDSIGEVHGESFPTEARWGRLIVFPLYHPAAVLYNRQLEEDVRRDLRELREIISRPSRSGP
jgi:uracil-DNA glycosylase family 4